MCGTHSPWNAVSALDIIYGKIGLDNSIVITGMRDLNPRCFH